MATWIALNTCGRRPTPGKRSARAGFWAALLAWGWLCVAGWAAPALAADLFTDQAIYQAQVPVADNTDAARAKALPQALAKVLVRVTGDPQVAQSPAAKPLLSRASQLMQSYSYVQLPNGKGLRVSFDPSAVKAAVKARNLPVWGAERPKTLVWLAIRGGPDGRQVVSSDNAQGSAAGLVQTARARGVPLIFPLMDLQDQQKVSFSDVWGAFQKPIEQASKRYPHSDVLIAGASGGSNQWQVHWTLIEQGQQEKQWQTGGSTLDEALASGADDLASFFANRFAVAPGGGSSHSRRIVVDHVNSVQQYASLLTYLQGLTAINSVHTSAVHGNRVTLQVQSSAAPGHLRRMLGLSGLLAPVKGAAGTGGTPGSGTSGAAGQALTYRLSSSAS